LNKEGKIPGVPEEPEPGANDACLKSSALFDIVNLTHQRRPVQTCEVALLLRLQPSRQELRKHCGGGGDVAVESCGNAVGIARFEGNENKPVLLV